MIIKIKENLEHLNKIIRNFGKIEKILFGVGEYMLSSVEENFQVSGRPKKWRKLSVATLKSGYKYKKYKKRGGITKGFTKHITGKKILIDSGRLKNSIAYKVNKTKLYVGTTVIYAALHQFGGYAGRNKKVYIPARPYLLMQERDRGWITDLYRKELWGENK